MNKQYRKMGDSKYFILYLYEKHLYFESRHSIISTNVKHANNYPLYFLRSKDLVSIKSL